MITKKYPKVSIIIANWNGADVFNDTLLSLSKISYPNWELIVVDNGSTDGTQELPLSSKYKFKNPKLIKNATNMGFAPANNQGYQASGGKYILLLNNDTLVEKDFLEIMVEKMEKESNLGVLQPKIKIMDNPLYLDNTGSFMTKIGFLHHTGFMKKDGEKFNNEKEVFSVKGACMLIRRSVVEKIGLFDSDFFSYFEESDFCWRVWLVGYRCIYYPSTFIRHKVGFTIKRMDVGNLNWHYYKNRICSLIKNLSLFGLVTIIPAHLFISIGISFAFLIKGGFWAFLIVWKAICWNILNLNKTLVKRKEIQGMREISDKYIFNNLAIPIDLKVFFGDFNRVSKDIAIKKN